MCSFLWPFAALDGVLGFLPSALEECPVLNMYLVHQPTWCLLCCFTFSVLVLAFVDAAASPLCDLQVLRVHSMSAMGSAIIGVLV